MFKTPLNVFVCIPHGPPIILTPLASCFDKFWRSYDLFSVRKTQKSPWKRPKKSQKGDQKLNSARDLNPRLDPPNFTKRDKNTFFSTFSLLEIVWDRSRPILKNIFKKVLSFKKYLHFDLQSWSPPSIFKIFRRKCAQTTAGPASFPAI